MNHRRKKITMSLRKTWWKYPLAIFIGIFFLLPLYVLILMSIKTNGDYSSRLLPPNYLYLGNYTKALVNGGFFTALLNTVIVTFVSVLIIVVFGCMAAYPLSRNRSRLNGLVFSFCMGVMMIPGVSLLVGMYTQMVSMNGINHLWSVIASGVAFGLPTAILLYTNFMNNIPVSLDEAATVDGASTLRVFWHIILPELRPVTATIIIQQGVSAWNSYIFPSYFLQKPSKYTLVLLIQQYFGTAEGGRSLNTAAAVATLATLPIIVLYLSMQKYFIQGQIDSSIK